MYVSVMLMSMAVMYMAVNVCKYLLTYVTVCQFMLMTGNTCFMSVNVCQYLLILLNMTLNVCSCLVFCVCKCNLLSVFW